MAATQWLRRVVAIIILAIGLPSLWFGIGFMRMGFEMIFLTVIFLGGGAYLTLHGLFLLLTRGR